MSFGTITFLGIWLYAILSWGLLIGLIAGWLSAIIGGVVLGLLWPLALIFIIWFFFTYLI